MFMGERILLKAEIVAIGNEIISGLIQDTNGRYLSKQLHLLGIGYLITLIQCLKKHNL